MFAQNQSNKPRCPIVFGAWFGLLEYAALIDSWVKRVLLDSTAPAENDVGGEACPSFTVHDYTDQPALW